MMQAAVFHAAHDVRVANIERVIVVDLRQT
jgi:hypothetical protein